MDNFIFTRRGLGPDDMREICEGMISDAVVSIYTLAGSITFSQLPPLTSDYIGYVYEITEDFTTTEDFVEGAGKNFPSSTNVSIVNRGTKENPVLKYDASIGDLSSFQTKRLDTAVGDQTTVEGALQALSSGKVDKNGTDSLMSADEHTKLSGIAAGAEVNVQSDWNEADTESDAYINNKPTLGTAARKDYTDLIRPNSHDLAESGSVYNAIIEAMSSVYTPRGSITCEELVSSMLTASNVGNCYNVTNNGTTTADYVQGAGKTINAGDTIGIIKAGADIYKFNLMGNTLDLHDYQTKTIETSVAGQSTVQTALTALNTNKAEKSELGGKTDKVTNAVSGNFASLDSNGNLMDSGKSASDYYTKSEIDTLLASYLRLE